MTHQLESSKTLSRSVSCFQRTSRWGCTRVYGTQTIGQLEEVLLKRIGPKLHSWLLTETLRSTPNQTPTGTLKKWIQLAKLDSDGSKRITWSTITALTVRGSHREPLKNAQQALKILIISSSLSSMWNCECSVSRLCVSENFLFLFMFLILFIVYLCPIKGNGVSLLL